MNIMKFLQNEIAKFQIGFNMVYERRKAWDDFEKMAITKFENFCSEAKKLKLFNNLYVDSKIKRSNTKEKLPPYLTLFWGQHPTGAIDFREEKKGKNIFEGGCALHLSQALSGEVVVIFYPFISELRQPKERYYVYKVYSSPNKINVNDLNKLIQLLFVYAHFTSFAGNPSKFDWLKMKWLQIRSKLCTIWNSDWMDFMFSRAQKIIESHIDIAKSQ